MKKIEVMTIVEASDHGWLIIGLGMVRLIDRGVRLKTGSAEWTRAKVMRDPKHGLYGVAMKEG